MTRTRGAQSWGISVTTADGRKLSIEWDPAGRMAYIVCDLAEPVTLADGRTITSLRVPVAAESWRSIASVIAGWPR